jgi:hypothetical protein
MTTTIQTNAEPVWELIELPALTMDQKKSIMRKKAPCPICNNNFYYHPLYRDKNSGIEKPLLRRCICVSLRCYASLAEKISRHYAHIRLDKLDSSPLSALSPEVQRKTISMLQTEPDKSYFFFGPAKTSKTTFSIALYQNAIQRFVRENPDVTLGSDVPIWRISARTLLEQYHNYAISREEFTSDGKPKKVAPREVTREKIEAAARKGFKPRLFLEEIDKIKPTDFRLSSLFEVIDAIYECDGQLVMSTNLTPDGLVKFLGEVYGHTIPRRVVEAGNLINFFGAK